MLLCFCLVFFNFSWKDWLPLAFFIRQTSSAFVYLGKLLFLLHVLRKVSMDILLLTGTFWLLVFVFLSMLSICYPTLFWSRRFFAEKFTNTLLWMTCLATFKILSVSLIFDNLIMFFCQTSLRFFYFWNLIIFKSFFFFVLCGLQVSGAIWLPSVLQNSHFV